MRSVRGLLFDLGSTLWQRAPDEVWHRAETAADARAGRELRRHIGSELLPPLEDADLGTALRRAIEEGTKRAHQQEPDDEPDFAEISRQALEVLLERPIELKLGVTVFEALRVRIPDSRVLFPDTIPTLQELCARGYLVGVATNRAYGGDLFLEDLRVMGLMPFFSPQAIAISADLGVRKPNRRIFEHALSGLGLPPTQAAMIGDNIIADVWGAERAHVLSIWRPAEKLRALAGESLAPGEIVDAWDRRPERLSHLQAADADLVSWAERRAHTRDPRTFSMRPPDAVIANLSDLLSLFPEAPER
jgi:putative hydrolase of the HAD superfamily